MLNLAVHIVTTSIQSVDVYRICICYFFTKYNNNIAGCLHSIKRTSSVPNAAVCLCNIKHTVDRDRCKVRRAAWERYVITLLRSAWQIRWMPQLTFHWSARQRGIPLGDSLAVKKVRC